MNNIIKKYIGKSSLMMAFALMATGTAMTSCSDDTLSNINTDKTKVDELDPNAQLTTALLQTYGDFSLMDTYRNYITGFPQYFAGGYNVSNYAGSNFREDDMTRRVWDRYYEISIKNLVDAIHKSTDKANLNAALRAGNRKMLYVMLPFYIFLCLATIYIQAHYLIDAIAGLISAVVIYFALMAVSKGMIEHHTPSSRLRFR